MRAWETQDGELIRIDDVYTYIKSRGDRPFNLSNVEVEEEPPAIDPVLKDHVTRIERVRARLK